jgi:uncharacterized protein YecE (DUF72 family)
LSTVSNKTYPYYIGLPQWHHPEWYAPEHNDKDSLSVYSKHFSSIEGNNSFYGLPTANSVKMWAEQTPPDFRFCFKFPRSISHSGHLQSCDDLVEEFLLRISPLEKRIGIIWLQLSQQFSPQHLDSLNVFLENLPKTYHYAVEVRNLSLFDKSDNEIKLNQILKQHKVNRVIFDTRSLFSNMAEDAETLDALRKKPRVPTHVIALAERPLVRFISPLNLELSKHTLKPWVGKLLQWIDEGRTPYIFFHTPGNENAPELAKWFSQQVSQARPEIKEVPLWDKEPKQAKLF